MGEECDNTVYVKISCKTSVKSTVGQECGLDENGSHDRKYCINHKFSSKNYP